jgi:hypothetical protein
MLSPVEQDEIFNHGNVKIGKYRLKYIPGKFLSISEGHHTISYYDLAQFYEMSLNRAAAMYVGDQKDDGIDRARLGIDRYYWIEKALEILEYCIQDCRLTALLGEILQAGLINAINFTPSRYISKAYIAKKYFQRECEIPDIRNLNPLIPEVAYNAYYGGRFECLKRGHLGVCTQIDINSAYPFQISRLMDISRGKWKFANRINRQAVYGFYNADVTVPYTDSFNSLPFRHKSGLVLFPSGELSGAWEKAELETAINAGCDVRIRSGIEFFPGYHFRPFEDVIENLYHQKSISKKGSMEYELYKKIMNAYYGVNFEKTLTGEAWQAGILFNPIYAAIITARTRVQLYEEALKYGDKVVAFHTDSILIQGEFQKEKTKKLGDFDIDSVGESVLIKSGLYRMGSKTKRRGVGRSEFIREHDSEYLCYDPKTGTTHRYNTLGLIDFMTGMEGTKLPVSVTRPVHFREAMIQHRRDDINLFLEKSYEMDINNDKKRIWDFDFTAGKELLTRECGSVPLLLE